MLAADKALQDAPAQQAGAIAAGGAATIFNALLEDRPDLPVKTRNFTVAAEQNALEITKALKLERLHSLIGWFFSVPARRITETIFQYDRLVGSEGLAAGSAWLLEQFARVVVVGMPPPSHGPLLVVGNHPG